MNSEIAGDGTPLRVTHTFTRFQTLGGVESLLQRHLQVDANQGLLSSIRAFFEPLGNVSEGVRGLGCTKWSVPQGARLRMAREASQHPSDVSIYHNCWGSAFAGAVDQSHRRLGLHHSDWPGVEHILRSQNGVLDGMLCIGEAVEKLVRRECPFLADQRCLRLSLPISPPPTLPREIASRRGPIVIGVCGRVVKAQKRVDRIPEVIQRLEAARLDFRLEILGIGDDLDELKGSVGQNPRVIFHGRKSGLDYWRIIDDWDAILFLSDYEGLPLALLEGLARGVLPIYPSIQSGGDRYVTTVDAGLLYPPGDLSAVSQIVGTLARRTELERQSLRQTAMRVVQPHLGDVYERTIASFIRSIRELPKVSQESSIRRSHPGLYVPFGILRRLNPQRLPRRGIV